MSASTPQQTQGSQALLRVLNEYIQPSSTTTASQAAASFAQGVKTPNEEFFWDFWNNVFSTAERIPHASPQQDKLVSFVRELTLLPETGDKIWETRVWTGLPLLGAAIRERLNRSSSSVSTAAWISFHAFVARLLHAGVSPGSETTAIWMLRDALEQDAAKAGSDADRDLMAAAVYIEYAGATLVQKLALQPEPQLDEAQQRSLKGGALWKGKSGLNLARWAFWGRHFREQGEKAAGQEAKELALHAARLIEMWTQTRFST
ncbi:hypothetical protein F5Y10DRAFT_231524 [Nemania abortiva]|nr:hypothetical protein F5Y10DRAFT_231524 [Nemania abortiva]